MSCSNLRFVESYLVLCKLTKRNGCFRRTVKSASLWDRLSRMAPDLESALDLGISLQPLFGSVRLLGCRLFVKELLTRLVTCNFIVCGHVFVHLSLDVWDKLWVLIWLVPEYLARDQPSI